MKILAFITLSLAIYCVASYPTASFSKLNLSKNDLTVSGISSGAFFADQIQVIYSSIIKGSGSMAGGPFYCAQASLTNAMMDCMYNTMQINVQTLAQQANTWASQGLIDPVSNLKNAYVWIQSGTQDTTVKQNVSVALQQFYEQFNVNIVTDFTIPCAHNWVNDKYGNQCGISESPYIANCNTPTIYQMLTQIYGGTKTIKDPVDQISANLFQFDQTQFYPSGGVFTCLDSTGYAYIPTACQQGEQCSLHFAFHGCQQNYNTIQDQFITETHLNEYAESNNIVLIFPQVDASSYTDYTHQNTQGCWDWWGYTDSNYSNNKGTQSQFFRNMVKALLGI